MTTPTKAKIVEKLTAIVKQLSTTPSMIPMPLTYAKLVHPALPHSTPENPVPNRVQTEVLVKVIEDLKPTQTNRRLVE